MKHKTCFSKVGAVTAIYLTTAFLALGCLKVQKKDSQISGQTQTQNKTKPQVGKPPEQPKKPIINRELRLDDIFVETVGQDQPNIYDMVFSWPITSDSVRVSYNGQVLFVTKTFESEQSALKNLQGGRSYPVFIEILDEQNHIIDSETRNLEIPKDYIFPKNFKLTSHMKITNDRVFMSDSVITTEQFNLEIKTRNLIILEKSYIQGFEPSTKAKHGSDGRSGGNVMIQAMIAEGDLDITMNSEAGGDGFKGFDSPPCNGKFCFGGINCQWGTKGKTAGRNGDLIVKIQDNKNFKMYYQEVVAAAGIGGPSQAEVTDPNYPVVKENRDCKWPPHKESAPHGQPGQSGKVCISFAGSPSVAGCE